MPSLYPLLIFCLLATLYTGAFLRTLRGKGLKLYSVILCFALGVMLILIVFLVLTLLSELFGLFPVLVDVYADTKPFTSPIIEDTLKILLLSFVLPRISLTRSVYRLSRSKILAGVYIGLAFGLVETYVYSVTLGISQVSVAVQGGVFGSIPLQMLITAGFSAVVAKEDKKILYIAIMIAHLMYNQFVLLPVANLALIVLSLGSIVLLVHISDSDNA